MAKRDAKTISDRVLYTNDNLVVALPQRTSTGPVKHKYNAYCFQVLGWDKLLYRGLALRNTSGSTITLSAGSGQDYIPLHDLSGDQLLRIGEDVTPWIVYHFSLAVQQDSIRIYPQAPEATERGGFEWLGANQPDPTAGDKMGYTLGSKMDYYDPPRDLESLAWRKGDEAYFSYGWYNEDTVKHQPRLNVVGRTYLLKPYGRPKQKKKLIAGPPAGPHRSFISFGTVRQPYDYTVPDEWEDAHIEITQAQLPTERGGQ